MCPTFLAGDRPVRVQLCYSGILWRERDTSFRLLHPGSGAAASAVGVITRGDRWFVDSETVDEAVCAELFRMEAEGGQLSEGIFSGETGTLRSIACLC